MGKVLSIVLIIIATIFLAVSIFLIVYKPFGGIPNNKDKENYAKRSDIFKDGKFVNSEDFEVMGTWEDPFKDRIGTKGVTPKDEIPTIQYQYTEPKEDEVLITWFGHSSSLIQIHGLNILVDPIFENITSPVSFIGPRRFSKVPVNIDDLPEIDLILITHDHYDHLDYRTQIGRAHV